MRAWLTLGLAAGLLLAACAQTPTPTVQAVRFSVVTDNSTAPLMDELAAAYRSAHPQVEVEIVSEANSERALAALRAGGVDLAGVAWLPDDAKEGELWFQPFARHAVAVVTHRSNPVGDLTLSQLRDIFQGQTLSWVELGGLAVEVIPVSREDGSGTRQVFESLVMGARAVSPTAVVMPGNRAVVEFVARTPGAIGYVSMGWLSPMVNIVAVEGVTPSAVSVEKGRYLLSRPFYLVVNGQPGGGVADFVAWLSTADGQAVVRRHYAPAP